MNAKIVVERQTIIVFFVNAQVSMIAMSKSTSACEIHSFSYDSVRAPVFTYCSHYVITLEFSNWKIIFSHSHSCSASSHPLLCCRHSVIQKN